MINVMKDYQYSIVLVLVLVAVKSFITISLVTRLPIADCKSFNNDETTSFGSNSTTLQSWQECSIFLAPTKTMNWGVYANRDFDKGEIVDIAGLTIPIKNTHPAVENTVLADYVYGYWRIVYGDNNNQRPTVLQLYSVLIGYDMFYNHHPTQPNVEFQTFGREPDYQHNQFLDAINPQGFIARRKITEGEELFSTYKNNNQDDGGIGWFRTRGIDLFTPSHNETTLSKEQLEEYSKQYCSKIVSGVGLSTWTERLQALWPPKHKELLPFWIDEHKWLQPFDAGWGHAKAKLLVRKGERIEISTALVVSLKHIRNSALRPVVYSWEELYPKQQQVLQRLLDQKQFVVQYQGRDTSWKPIDRYTALKDIALFPAAGNIGMIRRKLQIDDKCNCRLAIHEHMPNQKQLLQNASIANVGVTIEVIAEKDIVAGEELVLDLPPVILESHEEYQLLYEELNLTGQPFNKEIFLQQQQQEYKKKKQVVSESNIEL